MNTPPQPSRAQIEAAEKALEKFITGEGQAEMAAATQKALEALDQLDQLLGEILGDAAGEAEMLESSSV
jgi:hypothetical protein